MFKVNNVVVPYRTGINKNKKTDLKTSPVAYYEQKVMLENAEMIADRVAEKESNSKKEEINQKLAASKTGTNKISKMNELYKKGKDAIFKETLNELFCDSLYLDESFVHAQRNNLKNYLDSHIDSLGGYSLLENAVKRTNSNLLKNIKVLCEDITNKVCKRKMGEDVASPTFGFDMNDDEKEAYDYSKNDLNMDELSSMVKQKVLTVVQDEKQKSTERDQFIQDIENELSSDDSLTSPAEVQEALNKILIKRSKSEKISLFEALMRSSYKELLQSSISESINSSSGASYKHQMDRREDVNDYDTEFDESESEENEHKDMDSHDAEKLNDPDIVEKDDTDLQEEHEKEEAAKSKIRESHQCGKVDMDVVMAEAITKYTLLEVLNLIKLDELNYTKVTKLISDLTK